MTLIFSTILLSECDKVRTVFINLLEVHWEHFYLQRTCLTLLHTFLSGGMQLFNTFFLSFAVITFMMLEDLYLNEAMVYLTYYLF